MDKNKLFSKFIIGSILAGTVAGLPINAMADVKLPTDLNEIKSQGSQEAVKYLYEMNKLGGYTDGTFRPTGSVTRAEFIAMVLRTSDFPVIKVAPEFLDSNKGDWHYSVLQKAYKTGLLNGKATVGAKLKMAPGDVITRQEMLAILVRAHEIRFGSSEMLQSEVQSVLSKYADSDELPKWATTAMAKAVKYKITSGVSSNTLGGSNKGNRLESAVFSYRLLKEVQKVEEEAAKIEVPVVEEPIVETPVVEEPNAQIEEDKIVPTITLNGPDILYLTKGDAYVENGASATDDRDGDVSEKIVITSEVVSDVLGTYVVKYNVTDGAGNKAIEVVRTIIVEEAVPVLDPDVVYLKNNKVLVEEATSDLAARFNKETSKILFVSEQPLNDGGTPVPVDYTVADVENLIIALKHGTTVGGEFPNTTLYTVQIVEEAADISIDLTTKVVTVASGDTLDSVKSAFEARASAIFGTNEVILYQKNNANVLANMTVFMEDVNHNIEKTMKKFSFGDNLLVTKTNDSLTVEGLVFEDALDLYKWNGSAFVEEQFNAEVRPTGQFTFTELSYGKYKVVKQPLDLGKPGDDAYDDEYNKRLINEDIHEIEATLTLVNNSVGKYRIQSNYGTFGFDTTDNTANFFKTKQKVAEITGSGEMYASVIYENREERLNLKSINMNFGMETFETVTYQTIGFDATGDFSEFVPGEVIKFTVVIEDKETLEGEAFSRTDLKLQAQVVTNPTTGNLSVQIVPQEDEVSPVPSEPVQDEVGLAEDVVYLSNSTTQIVDAKQQLSTRFNHDFNKIYILKNQSVNDGAITPTDYRVDDVENLFITVKHGVKEDEQFPKETVYKILIDENAADIGIDVFEKTVKAKSTHTLSEIVTSFETKASAVIGANEVTFYSVGQDGVNVRGDMVVLFKNEEKQIVKSMSKYVFEDSLIVELGFDKLTVTGLQFEDKIDLYKWDGSAYAILRADVEIGVKGLVELSDLLVGKYKVVKQPLELGFSGNEAFDSEYAKRVINENEYEILPQIDLELNENDVYRVVSNYENFAFENVDNTADFLKNEVELADITGNGKLYAKVVYDNRVQLANFNSMTMTFGTEDVDVDGNPGTPDVAFHTLALNVVADFAEFSLGEVVNFTLQLINKDAIDGEEKVKVELQFTSRVEIDNETDSLTLIVEEVK